VRRLAVVCVAAAGVAGCGSTGVRTRTVQTTTTKIEVVKPPADAAGFDPEAIYRQDGPGVVEVLSLSGQGQGGVGSGFVLTGDGEIVTNAHVVTEGQDSDIREVDQVYVEFADGNRVPARILGFDPDADVALLKIDPAGLTLRPLTLGDSDTVSPGQPVAAIGSPFEEAQSLSVGIVSAIDRDVQSLTKFSISGAIQTDAAINPGNSGGPLVDARGAVLGLNQQIQTDNGGGEGVGFAVPIDLAKRSVAQIREHGRVDYAYLGVQTRPVYPQLAEHFGLPVDKGAWLQAITDGAPADKAGLIAGSGGGSTQGGETFQGETDIRLGGDIIVKLGSFPVDSPTSLADAVTRLQPGQTVPVVIYRDGKQKTVQIELAKRPG
jgi:S1-C subfamily serine protease